jgi:DNA-binding XRE family transcriptional regulator
LPSEAIPPSLHVIPLLIRWKNKQNCMRRNMQNVKHNNVPNCLRKYRRARGLKQSEVARILGLKSASIVSRWEKGVCLPSTVNALKLALIYRTLVDALYIDLLRALRPELRKREEKVLSDVRS